MAEKRSLLDGAYQHFSRKLLVWGAMANSLEEPLGIPAVTFVDGLWVAPDDGMTSHAKRIAGSGRYQAAMPTNIADYEPHAPASLVADMDEALAALVRFENHVTSRLGSESPALWPMGAVLLRTESMSSSQIEQITASARQLALAQLGRSSSVNANTVVGNVAAMEAGIALGAELDTPAILAMHRALLSRQQGIESEAGKFRDRLVWVGRSGATPVTASHVGPPPEAVPPAIEDLVRFMARWDLPFLLQAAVAHAQFETIHPFVDGNGRTGRALVHGLLRRKGVATHATAPLSAGLLTNTRGYFDALGAYREGDARPIVERFCEASRFAWSAGAKLVDELAGHVSAGLLAVGRLNAQATARRVVPWLVSQPVVDV
ncbi:MAG: Fic family protein, partial [Propionibacteriaceae bacterium]|nr:Fic family protein [Propionibacteriaceae bacterium]